MKEKTPDEPKQLESVQSDLERLLAKPVSILTTPNPAPIRPVLSPAMARRYMTLMGHCPRLNFGERQEFHDLMDIDMDNGRPYTWGKEYLARA